MMPPLPDPDVTLATEADLPTVVALVNGAYRGTGAQAGWTTEAHYIDGQRTSLADLEAELAAPNRPQILTLRQGGEMLACAMLELVPRADGALSGHIGMLTVRPGLQNGGVGRRMLTAAEAQARRRGADRARMGVVNIRDTLIAWYERRGYRLTGEESPFPYDDPRFGLPKVAGLKFVVMERRLDDDAL